ncbi:putative membrane protein isoform 1 [Schistosoma japonicum]|uniref:Glycerophosphocholine acyltransferase 1 n=1 Tax=Schistosoma japonicum TaxID=6182 RepID=A0A4Z2D577_SCHJA|nr:putative membrane protein isoform 1 [Schistosoma japonicum]
MKLCEKLCFVGAMSILLSTMCLSIVRPALLLYNFSFLYICLYFLRLYNYWKNKYLLFMLDQCYFINFVSLIFVWLLPHSHTMQLFQFGLANAHAYGGTFLFRNALVLHDIQRLTSCLIHVLPALYSFLIRWHPSETSVWWYTDLYDSHASRELLSWNKDVNWFWLVGAPVLFHFTREVLYYIIIYGIVKPGDEYLDSFRYLHKKKILWRFFWKHIDDRWHLIGWIACNIVLCTILLLIAIIAWCNYLFHITMLIIQTLTLTWNGACFYLDYFPIEYTRNLQIQPNQGVIIISKNENHINNNETADERIIQDDVYNNVAASIFSCYPSPDESHSKVFHDGNITIDEEKNLTGGSNITH